LFSNLAIRLHRFGEIGIVSDDSVSVRTFGEIHGIALFDPERVENFFRDDHSYGAPERA
jgi:hypothetical protein